MQQSLSLPLSLSVCKIHFTLLSLSHTQTRVRGWVSEWITHQFICILELLQVTLSLPLGVYSAFAMVSRARISVTCLVDGNRGGRKKERRTRRRQRRRASVLLLQCLQLTSVCGGSWMHHTLQWGHLHPSSKCVSPVIAPAVEWWSRRRARCAHERKSMYAVNMWKDHYNGENLSPLRCKLCDTWPHTRRRMLACVCVREKGITHCSQCTSKFTLVHVCFICNCHICTFISVGRRCVLEGRAGREEGEGCTRRKRERKSSRSVSSSSSSPSRLFVVLSA